MIQKVLFLIVLNVYIYINLLYHVLLTNQYITVTIVIMVGQAAINYHSVSFIRISS